jgi:hypothetical protein
VKATSPPLTITQRALSSHRSRSRFPDIPDPRIACSADVQGVGSELPVQVELRTWKARVARLGDGIAGTARTSGVADHAGRAAFPRIGTRILANVSQGGGAMSRFPRSLPLRPVTQSGAEPEPLTVSLRYSTCARVGIFLDRSPLPLVKWVPDWGPLVALGTGRCREPTLVRRCSTNRRRRSSMERR